MFSPLELIGSYPEKRQGPISCNPQLQAGAVCDCIVNIRACIVGNFITLFLAIMLLNVP